jgi:hypothetical protein
MLGKLVAMVVDGDKVSKDQAKEIIIRTDSFNFNSDDAEFKKELICSVNEILNANMDLSIKQNSNFKEEYGLSLENRKKYNKAKEKINLIEDIFYLQNDRITSLWMEGPHGWCDWEGNIFCNNYTIGKYPSFNYYKNEKYFYIEVEEEWKIIAKEFPFLNLKCQLYNGNVSEKGIYVVAQYDVKDGNVTMKTEDFDKIAFPVNGVLKHLFSGMYNSNIERGCTIEQFREALEYVLRRAT